MSGGTSWIAPFAATLDLETGAHLSPGRLLVRRASDMRGYYRAAAALETLIEDGDPPHYEVVEIPVPETHGHLASCLSTLQPGRVGDECFMTKGHYHAILDRGEIYLGLRGEGLLLMKTAEGKALAEPLVRGALVYVPPGWAHRSVNVGGEPLVSFCVYPADAGHEYGDIARTGFPQRVYLRAGRAVVEQDGQG
jgi:glucose-6-phosphate isomerase